MAEWEEWPLMVDDCKTREERMTEWEQHFIDSLSKQESITPRQQDILNKIWEKVTANG